MTSRRTSLRRLALFIALAVPISGCDQVNDLVGKKEEKTEKKKSKKDKDDEEEDEDEDDKKGSSSASASASTSAAPSAAPAAEPSASASSEAAPSASGSAPPAPLPGHSPVPTTAEWEAASEVTVTNSSKLGCETKALREWVRVTCKRINDSSGKPDFVGVYKGNEKNEVFTFVPIGAPHIASLVFPFQTGTDLEAKFGWDDGQKAKFTSQWPNGSPKPAAYGKFEVAAPAATPTATAKKDPPKVEPPKVEPPKKDPPKPPIRKERLPKKDL